MDGGLPKWDPIVNECDEKSLLEALESFCRIRKIDYIELGSSFFQPDSMLGAAYVPEHDITYVIRVASPEDMWHRMKKNARNPIRQAEKKGVCVEIATDISAIGEFYKQLEAVFARQGLTPWHAPELLYDLWESLSEVGKLLTLRAVHNGRCVATHLLAFDERAMYAFAVASWPDSDPPRANDLLHWVGMKYASEHGIPLYDMCGGGSFKAKFGSEVVPRVRWHKSLTTQARIARELYKAFWFGRRKLLHCLRGLTLLRPRRGRRR